MDIIKINTNYNINGTCENSAMTYNGQAIVNSNNKIETIMLTFNDGQAYSDANVRFSDESSFYSINSKEEYTDIIFNVLKDSVIELKNVIRNEVG